MEHLVDGADVDAALMGDGEGSHDKPLEDLGMDSLAVLTLREAVESRFGVVLDTRAVLGATLASLADHLAERLAAAAASAAARDGETPATPTAASADAMQHSDAWSGPGTAASIFAHALNPRPTRWFPLPHRSARPLVMVLTTLRSGSSLLNFVLNAHEQLFAPQGLFLLPYSNLAERRRDLQRNLLFLHDGLLHAVAHLWATDYAGATALVEEWEEKQMPMQAVYELLQQRCSPKLLVDRGTENARSLDVLRRASRMFTRLRVVHLCRHPYAVLHSGASMLRRTAVARRIVAADAVAPAAPQSAFEDQLHEYIDRSWGMMHANVLEWLDEIGCPSAPTARNGDGGHSAPATSGVAADCDGGRDGSAAGEEPISVHRVRFEDLTALPEPTLTALCKGIGLPFDRRMLTPYADVENVTLHSASGEAGVASRDPKLMAHSQISSCNSEAWKRHKPQRPLTPLTSGVARALGYELLPTPRAPLAFVDSDLLERLNSDASVPKRTEIVLPVIIAPGSDGELIGFAALGKALEGSGTPLLGLRATADVPRDCIRHTASAYVATILERLASMGAAADGCIVAGMSSGGCVAYELTVQLLRAGVAVRRVLTIDRNPFQMEAPLFKPWAGGATGSVGTRSMARSRKGGCLGERLAELDRELEAHGATLTESALLSVLKDTGSAAGMGTGGLEIYARRYVASHRLIHTYTPSVPLEQLMRECASLGAMVLFKAEETPGTTLHAGMRQVEIRDCHHFSILSAPAFVRAFVDAVEEARTPS